jgi:hypothetical protein
MSIVFGLFLPQAGASGNPTDGNYPAGVSGAHYPGGCPINGLPHGLTNVYQCLQVGQKGNGGIGDRYYDGIQVDVNSVQYKPGTSGINTGLNQDAFRAPGELLVDATVENVDYAPNGVPEGITAGNWWVASYDSQWQGAQTSYGGNILSPSKDELTAKCSNLSKCNFWENESAYTCGNFGLNEFLKADFGTVTDIVKRIALDVEEKQWQDLKNAFAAIGIDYRGRAQTDAELKAAAENVVGFLGNCFDAIVGIAPGESNTGILTFDAQVSDFQNRNVDLATPGHNIGIIWFYGGTGLEWVCKVDAKHGCQKVGALTSPPPPTTTPGNNSGTYQGSYTWTPANGATACGPSGQLTFQVSGTSVTVIADDGSHFTGSTASDGTFTAQKGANEEGNQTFQTGDQLTGAFSSGQVHGSVVFGPNANGLDVNGQYVGCDATFTGSRQR